MAKKDDENNKRLTAPTPTYKKIEASGNKGYTRPTIERKSNIVVSQEDLTPQRTQVQERQPIQVRGALAALQPKPVTPTQDMSYVQDKGYLTDKIGPGKTPTFNAPNQQGAMPTFNGQPTTVFDQPMPPTGYLMNKVTPNAPISPPNIPKKQEELPGRDIPVVGPILRGLDKVADATLPFSQGAAATMGVIMPEGSSIQDRPLNGPLDKALYVGGIIGGGLTNPAALEQNLITAPYRAAGSLVGSKLGQRAVNRITALNPALANVGVQLTPNAVNRGLTDALAGAGTGAAYSLISGQQSVPEVLRNALLGGALGGVGGVALGALGGAVSRLLKRNAVPDEQVQEILALPMGREDAARLNRQNNVQTPDVITPDAPILGLPSPRIEPPTTARIQRQTNPYREQFEDLIREAKQHEAAGGFSPGREDLELEQMWAARAGKEGVSLDELITRAYPSRPNRIQPGLVQQAKQNQAAREVAGAPMPVKSMSDRYKSGQLGIPESPVPTAGRAPTAQQGAQAQRVKASSRTRIEPRGALSEAPPRQTPIQGERALYSNVESTDITPELRSRMAESERRSYEPITNEETVAAANKRIDKDLEKAISYARSGGKTDAEKVATGFRALQELQKTGRFEEAADLVDDLAEKLTKAGQAVQAASLISRLSPEGQLIRIQRRINELNKRLPEGKQIKLTPETTQKITETAEAAQAARLSEERAAEVLQITEKLRAGQQLTEIEKQTLSDFADDLKTFMDDKKPDLSPPKQPPELRDPRKRDRILAWLEEKATSAAERLRRRRNTLSANPFDTWVDMGIVTAAKMARRGVKYSDYVNEMVQEFGDGVRPMLQRAYNQGKKTLTRESKRIPSSKAKSAQKIIDEQIRSTEAGKTAEKYIQTNADKMTPAEIDNIRDLALKISKLQSGNRAEAEMQLQKILNEYEKSSWWDRVQGLRYIAMLLNTGTQLVNTLSGPQMATVGYVSDLFGAMADSVISPILRRPRVLKAYRAAPLQFLGNWFNGAKIGGKAGWHGVNPSGIAGPNDIRGLTYKGKNPVSFIPSLLERSLGAIAKGADYGTYTAIRQSELRRLARLSAKQSGLKQTTDINRYIENFMANPSEEAMDMADKIARNTTFQRQDTLGGKAANWINSSPGPIKPVTGAIFPFVRTPVNIAETAVNLTPAGILRGLYQMTSKSEATQREALRTLGLGITGTGLSALGFELSKLGIITGANDSGDKNVDAIREQAGRGKYRFNQSALTRFLGALFNGDGYEAAARAARYQQGDHQFDYNKLQPLAFPLAIGAGFEGKKGDVSDKLLGAGADAYGSLYGMSTLKGVQDVFQPSYTGTIGEKALGIPQRILTSFLKSFSPSTLAQEARREDETQRKTSYNNGVMQDTKEYYMSRTPGLSQDLQPNLTTLGQEKKNAPGIRGQFFNPYRSDVAPYMEAAAFIAELIDKTGDTSLAPSPPAKKVGGVPIPQERYTKLQKDIGNEIIKQIMAINPNLSDADKAKKVLDIYETVKKKYMDEVKRELGVKVSR